MKSDPQRSVAWRVTASVVPSLVAAVAVVALAAAMPWLSGRDPAWAVLRARHKERVITPEALEAVREQLNLPSNPFLGVWTWISNALRGDLGSSWVSNKPVAQTLPDAYLVSLELAAMSAVIAVVVALSVSCVVAWALVANRRLVVNVSTLGMALVAALPGLIAAIAAMWWFGVTWELLPLTGWSSAEHKVLPTLSLGLPASGVLAVICIQAVTTAYREEWVTTWRINGVRPWRLVSALVQRSFTIVVPYAFLLIAGVLGAAVVVEELFALPGMGRMALRAALTQDIPVVQACLVVLVLTGTVLGGVGRGVNAWLSKPLEGVDDGVHGGEASAVSLRKRPLWLATALLFTLFIVAGWVRSAEINMPQRKLSPSFSHPLGTDHLGRDVWARLADGAVLTIGAGLFVTVVVLVVGIALGLTRVGQSLADVLNAVPEVFLGLVIAAVVGAGWAPALAAVCLVAWIPLAVHTRTLAQHVMSSGFVSASMASGAPKWWLVWHHVVPLIVPAVVRHAAVRLPHVSLMIASLSFIGLGAGQGSSEWGKTLADAMPHLTAVPWAALAPVAALVVLGGLATPATREAESMSHTGRHLTHTGQ